MNLKFLLESYGQKEPTYFGPPEKKQDFLDWLKKRKHEVHSDGSVSVEGRVNLTYLDLVRIPFKFRVVEGYFYCGYNNLTSLEGAPINVGGDFACRDNNLTSLEGAPINVGGNFYCYNNKLTSLEGAPEVIKGAFVSNQFSDADYRAFAKKAARERKIKQKVDKELSPDLNVDLGDFS